LFILNHKIRIKVRVTEELLYLYVAQSQLLIKIREIIVVL